MNIQLIIGLLLTITAMAGFINYKFIKLPNSIGLTLVTLLLSVTLLILGKFGFALDIVFANFLHEINFKRTVMDFMLSFILFAGSLHINVKQMYHFRLVIAQLATIGVVISTLLIGAMIYYISYIFHLNLPIIYCGLFGALISPTDPIAVLGVLKRIEAPKSLEIKIAGEALFNDGVGIVMFTMLLNIAIGTHSDFDIGHIVTDFAREVIGGIVVGFLLGRFAKYFIKRVGSFDIVLSLTLALVTGGYALANEVLHVSGAIAMAVAGLVIGLACREGKMPAHIVTQLEHFWQWVDELLNAILFVLIGFVVLFLLYDLKLIIVSLLVIPAVLLARYLSVLLPVFSSSYFRTFKHDTIKLMTWGGLRGGVSIALALSIPAELVGRDVLVTMTYMVVMFSIIVQGLTIGPLIKRTMASAI
ncbi:MAG: sodium:proton antiporter [Gammaproteobacteria bacterium]|nr:sodium:proton antiporter [Gammaproteobacteria bacterium]